jgi:Heparinase II/III-like protein/Heparinase II/III N-terminus
MASRLTTFKENTETPPSGDHERRASRKRPRTVRHLIIETAISFLVLTILILKIADYVDPNAFVLSTIARTVSAATKNLVSAIGNLPFLNSCPSTLKMSDVSGGYVCVQPFASGQYASIYKSYPLVGMGREVIYSSTDQGSVQMANDLLRNVWDVPRYSPVQLPASPTWAENPYKTYYWRFEFYSLRPTLNLLYAFRTTGDKVYAKQLVSIDMSFIAAEPHSQWAWQDPHTVAFRCMSLIDTWWKLRQAHALSESASTAILRELENTGTFLADPNHYQTAENHDTNEAAALYNLAVAFPSLPNAQQWKQLAVERLEWQLLGNIDANGQLIENAPYYDFYTLEKFWEIYNYMLAQRQTAPGEMWSKLSSMINFASYILQPNSQVPLLGASLEATINYHGAYIGMANSNPQFLYVLTHGAKGSPPPVDSKFFPASSLTVMRSGWPSGAAYAASTYLTFNLGRYRTAHSDLDAMGITLYGDGGDLLPGPGLYTYAPGPYQNYFHGTESHNTVTVDGKSQSQGNGEAGPLVTKDGITYQASESSLYTGVQHRRMVMLLDPDHVLVIDQLKSASVHTYRQMFHLFPSAQLQRSGLTVSGIGGTPRREVTIQQLEPQGISESVVINRGGKDPAGLCSDAYGQLLPCYQISYAIRGREATFMTLLTIGQPQQRDFSINVDEGRVAVTLGTRRLNIALGLSKAVAPKAWATDPTPPTVPTVAVTAATTPDDWTASGGGTLTSQGQKGSVVDSLTASGAGPAIVVNDAIRLNLRKHGARLRLRVTGFRRISTLTLTLYSDGQAHSVTTDLLNEYTPDVAGEWRTFYIGPGGQFGSSGGWCGGADPVSAAAPGALDGCMANGPGINWADVDGMAVTLEANSGVGPTPTVSIGGLTLIPAQTSGKLVIIFDDGYQSILPAATYMHQLGMQGNIAVIGKYVDYPTQDYLNLYQLRALQNNWGWDMVNHTQFHVDAVQTYYDHNDLTGYASDILQQAAWLEGNGLNSAPNWIIYPHGDNNNALAQVVGHYYMFGRGVIDDPDSYPFGNPKDVDNLEIQYPGDGEAGETGYTSPALVLAAVKSAEEYHTTLLLTFHRIHSEPSDQPGYPLNLFEEVINGIRSSGIQVMTLSELDRSNGVPVNNHIYVNAGEMSLITATITG